MAKTNPQSNPAVPSVAGGVNKQPAASDSGAAQQTPPVKEQSEGTKATRVSARGQATQVLKARPPLTMFNLLRILLLYAAGFVGFHVLMTFVFTLGLMGNSRAYTIPFRAAFLFGTLAVFAAGTATSRVRVSHPVLFMVFGFWFLYLMRILYAGVAGVSLGTPWFDYLIKNYGIVVLPMLAFLVPLNRRENRFAGRVLMVSAVCGSLVLLYGYWEYVGTSYRSLVHAGIDAYYLVSPHTISQSGALAVVIGLHFVLIDRKPGKLMVLLAAGGIFLGLLMMFWGASRYPFLALVCTFPIALVYSRHRTHPIIAVLFTIVAIGLLLLAMWGASHIVGDKLLIRFGALWEELQTGDVTAGSGRLEMWKSGVEQFLRNPVVGSGLEEKHTRYVVHNRYLEGFMATGLLGGSLLLVSSLVGVAISCRVLRMHPAFGWLSMMYLYRFFAGWGGAHVFDPIFWYSFMAVVSVHLCYRRRPRRMSPPPPRPGPLNRKKKQSQSPNTAASVGTA